MADVSKTRKLGKGLAGLMGVPIAVPVPPQTDSPAGKDNTNNNSKTIEQIPTYQTVEGKFQGRQAEAGGGAVGGGASAASPSSGLAGRSREGGSSASGVPSASLPGARPLAKPGEGGEAPAEAGAMPYVVVRIDEVIANRFQPRQDFEGASLSALAESIKRDGVMQPLVVRRAKREMAASQTAKAPSAGAAGGTPAPHVAKWELVAGERRLRAAQMAGLTRVPAVVVDVPDITAAMWAVVENVQRVDLGPLEKARAYARLAGEFNLTQAQIAEQVGEDRTLVSHYIRLNELEPKVHDFIRAGMLTFGHAKVLSSPLVAPGETREALADRVVLQAMSVRQLELMVQAGAGKSLGALMMMEWTPQGPAVIGGGGAQMAKSQMAKGPNEEEAERSSAEVEHERALRRAAAFEAKADVRDLEERIGKHLGTKVRIKTSGGGKRGVIAVEFFSLDHFEGLLGKMGVKKAD